MKSSCLLAVVVLAFACGGAAPPLVAPADDGAASMPVPLPGEPLPALSLAELLAPRPADVAEAQRLVVGAWDGRRYAVAGDGPLPWTEAEVANAPSNDARMTWRLGSEGRFVYVDGHCRSSGRDEVYEVRIPDGETRLELKITRAEGSCDGSPGWIENIRGLDATALVLIDGSTAGVTGFRRAP